MSTAVPQTQPIDQLLSRLELVRQVKPDHWRAKCPVHQRENSRNRTLSIVGTGFCGTFEKNRQVKGVKWRNIAQRHPKMTYVR